MCAFCALSSFVHRHRASAVRQTCTRKNQKRQKRVRWTDQAQPGTLSVCSRAVRLEPFPKTRAFMRRIAWISCVRPGHLTGCWLFKTGQKSLCILSAAARALCVWWLWEKVVDVLPSARPEGRCERCGKKHDIRFYLQDWSEEHARLERWAARQRGLMGLVLDTERTFWLYES